MPPCTCGAGRATRDEHLDWCDRAIAHDAEAKKGGR